MSRKLKASLEIGDTSYVSPKKKVKRLTFYNPSWETEKEFQDWLRRNNNDDYMAKCLMCTSTFSVQYEGRRAVQNHKESVKHRKAELAKVESRPVTSFFPKSESKEELKVIRTEVASIYHNVMHGHSYNSLDCQHKLYSVLFNDSPVALKIASGRTKSAAIVSNVLGVEAEKRLISSLKTAKYFSIASDASNKGNVKLFPYAVQYFDKAKGICEGLLDFYEDPHEGRDDIFRQIMATTTESGLSIQDVSAYSADNANVNYGCKKSVYEKLLKENSSIVKAGCNCHIIHNTIKAACKVLSMDVETLILKVYSEFSSSSLRVERLKEFAEFAEVEYRALLRHVATRWLSLDPALERILQNWPALKSLFLSSDADDCHAVINAFISRSKEDEGTAMNDGLPECYMYFLHNVLQDFKQANLKLQGPKFTSTKVFEVMSELLKSLEDKRTDCFYGSRATTILKTLKKSEQLKFKKDAEKFFTKAISYLNGHFDFSNNNVLKKLCISSLSEQDFSIEFGQLQEVVEALRIPVNHDQLYKDFCFLRREYDKIKLFEHIDQRWVALFKQGEAPELLKLISFVLSIPVSNAFAERVFSLLKLICTDRRNLMSIELLKAELQVKFNFGLTCREFYEYLRLPENKYLLRTAKESQKYTHKDDADEKC